MQIIVRNAKNRNLTSLLKTAAYSYANMLMSSQLVKNISVKIFVYDKLDRNANAYCCPDEYTRKPRSFEIELKRMRSDKMLKYLAHEMVHVKQFAKNELGGKYIKNNFITFWHGEICDIDSYWDQPWEIEAFTLEEELLCYFKEGHQY